MSVTAEPLHIPSHENQVVSVIGTEIPGLKISLRSFFLNLTTC